jgi:hypothetical protein
MAKGWRRSKQLNEERKIFAFMNFQMGYLDKSRSARWETIGFMK